MSVWKNEGDLTEEVSYNAVTPPAAAMTPHAPTSDALRCSLVNLFHRAREERFEPGVESLFSRDLIATIKRHGNAAIDEIGHLIHSPMTNAEVACVALQWIGEMDDPATADRRRALLEGALTSSTALIRDGAILGLTAMADPAALPSIQSVIRTEPDQHLRDDLIYLEEYLRSR